jgi:broad specificity phosphatase PhoE
VTATILLIRHARHADYGVRLSGRSDIPLTAKGLAEAERLGERLAERNLAAVQSSPLRRAQETAGKIARAAGMEVETHDGLNEIEFGGWSERSFPALEAEPGWRAWNTVRSKARPPGGETQGEATARAVAHLEQQAERHAGATIACVTHCDIIRGVICHYLGLPFDNLLRFDIDAASVSTLVIGPWGARVAGINA